MPGPRTQVLQQQWKCQKGCCNKCGRDGHITRECESGKDEMDRFRAELVAEAANPKTAPKVNK